MTDGARGAPPPKRGVGDGYPQRDLEQGFAGPFFFLPHRSFGKGWGKGGRRGLWVFAMVGPGLATEEEERRWRNGEKKGKDEIF